MGTYSGPHS